MSSLVSDTQSEHIPKEVDVIISGGGTVACIVAGRLAAADPAMTILILEAGPPTLNDEKHVQPAMFFKHFSPSLNTMKYVVAEKNENLGGRQSVAGYGQCLGGGSSINGERLNGLRLKL